MAKIANKYDKLMAGMLPKGPGSIIPITDPPPIYTSALPTGLILEPGETITMGGLENGTSCNLTELLEKVDRLENIAERLIKENAELRHYVGLKP